MKDALRFLATRMAIAGALAAPLTLSGSARAWDPSTTHVSMTERAALDSGVHRRWMDGSAMQRGLFTPLRIDPKAVDDEHRRLITLAIRQAHAGSGARGLGGPGACPGPSAPPSTRERCVEGDVWEMTALGWMKLGLVMEQVPRTRLLHHFVDRDDPAAKTWSDPELPALVLRAKHRRGGGALAQSVNRTGFEGRGTSALGWLEDADDPWAPPAIRAHLLQASLAPTAAQREHHLALAMIGVGALLHVVQDLSVPAHARGDLTAFFAPLSPDAGDRGLPLQEFIRSAYGRAALPRVLGLAPRASSGALEPPRLGATIAEHLLGSSQFEGLVAFTARRFLSESSLPPAIVVLESLDAEQAATLALGDQHGLAPEEVKGARLTPWPATAGYLVTGTGRGLAAFEVDASLRLRLYLDRRIYREQAAHLIPKGIEISASILDLVLGGFTPSEIDIDKGSVTVDLTAAGGSVALRSPALHVFVENGTGQRRPHKVLRLRPGQRQALADALPRLATGEKAVLVLQGTDASGAPWVAETVHDPAMVAPPAPPPKTPAPRRTPTGGVPKPIPSGAVPDMGPTGTGELRQPFGDRPDEPAETEPAGTEPAGTEPAGTEPAETKPAETEPAESEPAETKPTGTKPATKPAAKPAGTKPARGAQGAPPNDPDASAPSETSPSGTTPDAGEPKPREDASPQGEAAQPSG